MKKRTVHGLIDGDTCVPVRLRGESPKMNGFDGIKSAGPAKAAFRLQELYLRMHAKAALAPDKALILSERSGCCNACDAGVPVGPVRGMRQQRSNPCGRSGHIDLRMRRNRSARMNLAGTGQLIKLRKRGRAASRQQQSR